MAVVLHQPLGGLDRGATYSGPDEDFLVHEGYASRTDGKVVSGQAKNDQRLAVNREAPGEKPPMPKGDVLPVEEHPELYVAPDPEEQSKTVQRLIEEKWKGVEAGERDPNNPDVVLADAQKAYEESRDYDGSVDERVKKRQDAEAKALVERQTKQDEEVRARAQADHEQWLKDQDIVAEATVPDEKHRFGENGAGDPEATLEGAIADEANSPAKITEGLRGRNGVVPGPTGFEEQPKAAKKD